MTIVGTLPVMLANGTTADASQVMSDLNFIANQVNANAQPAGTYLQPGFISPGALVNIQVVAASAAYTPTSGANKAIIEAVGGGGGGGGALNDVLGQNNRLCTGSGGWSGGYLKVYIASGLQTYSGTAIVIGAGGAGGNSVNGSPGGDTTFGAVLTAKGGAQGLAGRGTLGTTAAPPFNGGGVLVNSSSLIVLINRIGEIGGGGVVSYSNDPDQFSWAGKGGNSPFGSGGPGDYMAGVGTGSLPTGFTAGHAGFGAGAGGGGAANFFLSSSSTNYGNMVGWPGSAGLMIIYEFE